MKASEIIAVIEKAAPPDLAAPWDASGVQVAAARSEVKSLAVMLDPCLPGLEEAVKNGADFILTHHPFSMKPRFPNRADPYLAALSLLLSGGVWLYSAHTPLDASPHGPARWLAEALALTGLRTLEAAAPAGPALADPALAPGFGFCGSLPAPLPYAEFCQLLSAALGRREWSVCGPVPRSVAALACCPGSGGTLLREALEAGADIFITGDVKYHAALEAEALGLRVIDAGHFVLEEEMMRRLALWLERELPLPVRFYPSRDPLQIERAAMQTTATEEDSH